MDQNYFTICLLGPGSKALLNKFINENFSAMKMGYTFLINQSQKNTHTKICTIKKL